MPNQSIAIIFISIASRAIEWIEQNLAIDNEPGREKSTSNMLAVIAERSGSQQMRYGAVVWFR